MQCFGAWQDEGVDMKELALFLLLLLLFVLTGGGWLIGFFTAPAWRLAPVSKYKNLNEVSL